MLLIAVVTILLTVVAMEGVAWLMHKYVLHGFLWFLHKSHHTRHRHIFELNDLFFVFYGLLSMLFVIKGSPEKDIRFWVGIGIGVYGLLYFLVHDVFIHRRIRLFGKSDNFYLKGLYIGHKIHHRVHTKNGSECFGMLWVAPKYFALISRKKDKTVSKVN
ncbi:MAG: fatty acid hydroxylase [Hymenobacteraceae bacterium]|nr:fatty acid hydroxylase [Hymenobacteraceae bacterium]MDX5397515.1 fatty acid hydroxylase [Hymenobacteraceae bacterium]MDX5443816.1 fatty acid hydroxylase [Hymenobacteraceae bacterium]MDX5513594.1 fatty acid hydroxylase [Hymenobacteraceae bacterium]